MANKAKKEYSKFVYQVMKNDMVVATFCLQQDAIDYANNVDGYIHIVGAY